MNKINVIIRFLIALIIISGCRSNDKNLERMPGIELPVQNMNSDLHLTIAENSNTFQVGDGIWLMLYNMADLPVVLDENYGVTIFKKTDDNWENVTNLLHNAPGNKWVLANGDELHRWVTVVVDPELFSDQSEQVRVVIVGNFVKDNGKLGKEVGAYIDVTLHPTP